MRVVILGAGTSIPAKDHSPSGIYIRAGREHLLFDVGPGTLQRLYTVGVSPFQLDRIFLTHYHVDHCLELVTILFALRIPQPVRKKPLTVYGPQGLTTLYRRLNQAFNGWLEPTTYRLALKEIGETTVRLPGYRVRSKRMHHSTAALGYRLEARGKSVVYSGDTDYCPEIIELGHDADVLILECSHPDERKVSGHLTPSECGQIAAAAHCKHLVLIHFYPVFKGYNIRQRVRRSFRRRLTLARDFTTLSL